MGDVSGHICLMHYILESLMSLNDGSVLFFVYLVFSSIF